jgi:hypothetical protein
VEEVELVVLLLLLKVLSEEGNGLGGKIAGLPSPVRVVIRGKSSGPATRLSTATLSIHGIHVSLMVLYLLVIVDCLYICY